MRQTKTPEGQSLVRELGSAVINFPLFIIEMVTSLLVLVISDIYIATLAIAGGTVGLATGEWEIGLATFFVLYSVSRVVNTVANAIGSAGQNVAMGINHGFVQHGNAIRIVAEHVTPEEGG